MILKTALMIWFVFDAVITAAMVGHNPGRVITPAMAAATILFNALIIYAIYRSF